MKVFTLKANENWFCDRYYDEWVQYTGSEEIYTGEPNEADIIWLLPSWQWRRVPLHLLKAKKIVATIHHIVPEKFNYEEFKQRDCFVDCYHVPCEQTKKNICQYTEKPIKVIGYWINTDLWSPQDKMEAREYLGLQKDKFVVGSFQRDTEGHDLKSPKLEKGPDLFVEYLKNLYDKDLHVLLGGWRRQYVINKLNEENIKFTYIKLAPFEKLQKMYAACDLYLVSSRYEGGPQAVLEAPAMKVPIVSSNVGMASDVLAKNCIIDVEKEVYYPTKNNIEQCYQNVLKYDINFHIQKYVKFFRELV